MHPPPHLQGSKISPGNENKIAIAGADNSTGQITRVYLLSSGGIELIPQI